MTDETETVNLTPRKREVLAKLCECQEGKGRMLPKSDKRAAGMLISDGLAWSLGVGGEPIYSATEKGRAVFSQHSSPA